MPHQEEISVYVCDNCGRIYRDRDNAIRCETADYIVALMKQRKLDMGLVP